MKLKNKFKFIDNQLDDDSSNIENLKSIPGVAHKTVTAILVNVEFKKI